jgi:hypothetical protein
MKRTADCGRRTVTEAESVTDSNLLRSSVFLFLTVRRPPSAVRCVEPP